MFDVESYLEWSKEQEILLPRAELLRGSVVAKVTSYRSTTRYLILHKKRAPLIWNDEVHNMVLNEDAPVAICSGCYSALKSGRRPRLALANGLFMGRTLARFAPTSMTQAHIHAVSPIRPSYTRVLLSQRHIFNALGD